MAIRIIRPLLQTLLIAGIAAAATGCAAYGGKQGAPAVQKQDMAGQLGQGEAEATRTPATAGPEGARTDPAAQGIQALDAADAVISMKSIGSDKFVPLDELARVLQFATLWDERKQTLRMGDNDLPYEFTINSARAIKNGDAMTLPGAPVMAGEAVYLPASAVADMFWDEMSYDMQEDRLIVHPSAGWVPDADTVTSLGLTGSGLNFGDDPGDPFKEPVPSTEAGTDGQAAAPSAARMEEAELPVFRFRSERGQTVRSAAAKTVDMDALIRKGMQYMGVKYQFGAPPYPESGRFDCSSFTQYVFGKYGVSLPRLARQQAQQGTAVSRKALRKGDLLFYYVPGRFKSNRTVGHVGIYMGGNRMLHASPKPNDGVQISNMDSPYWKKTFLFAKRVAS